MRDTVVTLVAATLCAALLQWLDRPQPAAPARGLATAALERPAPDLPRPA